MKKLIDFCRAKRNFVPKVIGLLLIVSSIIYSCENKNSEADPNEVILNGQSFTLKEYTAAASLNQLLFTFKNERIAIRIVLFKNDTGEFKVVPGTPAMKRGEATAQVIMDDISYFSTTGSVTIRKTSTNSYSGKFSLSSASHNNGQVEVKNGKFEGVSATSVNYGTVSDYEGNVYKTVKIGKQTWMAENLRSLKYANGDDINDVKTFYNVDSMSKLYGRLYTWQGAMHGNIVEMSQGACPTGWHIPTIAESDTLIEIAGGAMVAGDKLKSSLTFFDNTGYHHEETEYDDTPDNTLGFTAVASGKYLDDFEGLGAGCPFWNSVSGDYAGFTDFGITNYVVAMKLNPDKRYFAVRCIKNE